MTAISRYLTGAVSINGTAHSNLIDNSFQVSTSIAEAIAKAGGSIFASQAAMLTNKPVIRFATRNLALLAAPLALTSFKAMMSQYEAVGGQSASEIEIEITSGLAVPVAITGSPGQASQLTIEIYPTSATGLASPIAVNASSAITQGIVDAQYTLGACYLAPSTEILNIQSLNLNFGYKVVTTEGESGLPFAKVAYVDDFNPEITFQSADLSVATAARLNTGDFPATGMIFEWRKVLEGGVPSGGYRVTAAKCRVHASQLAGGRPANVQFSAIPVASAADGTGFLTLATFSGT